MKEITGHSSSHNSKKKNYKKERKRKKYKYKIIQEKTPEMLHQAIIADPYMYKILKMGD